ncbi:MAG: DUF4468 domain-containing protein, partial [Bacteroidota bacterium]
MKILLNFFFVLSPFLFIAQSSYDLNSEIPVDETGKIQFEQVFQSSEGKNELYNKAKEWFLNSKNLHGAYATTINREGGRVSGKGKFNFTHTLLTVPYEYRIHYVLTVDVKEQKARVRFSQFFIEEKANKSNQWKKREWPAEKNILDEVCYNIKGK